MKLVLHEAADRALSQIKQRPAGSYLLYGPAGIGKYSASLELAKDLGSRVPDLIAVAPQDKPSITIEQIRNTTAALSLQPYYQTGIRTVIIDQADAMTVDAGNALLKLLEEPPPRTLFILVATSAEALLPTIRSRTAAVYFPPPPRDQVVSLLVTGHSLKPVEAEKLTDAAEGAPGTAIQLASDPQAAARYLELADQAGLALSQPRFNRLRLAAALTASGADLPRFARLLQTRLTAAVRSDAVSPAEAATNLTALEHFRRQLAAKVAPRVALERLMLELA